MAINTRAYIEKYLQIRTKDARIIPLRLNVGQEKLYKALGEQWAQGKPMRAIVLKARQIGYSTLVEAMIFKRTVTRRNVKSGIVAHKAEATANLYNMSRLFYEKLPNAMKPVKRNVTAQELVFDTREGTGLKSSIKCMTAGGDGVGRSDTYQNLHVSEYAFWPGDKAATLAGLLASMPDAPDTMVVIESTANGYDDFKARWDAAVNGRSGYVPIFCGWNEFAEYRRPYDGFALTDEELTLQETYGLDNEQIAWRRWCIENNCNEDINMFHQEYPICPEEAFIASGTCVFDKEIVVARMEAVRKEEKPQRGMMRYETHGGEDYGLYWLDGARFEVQRGGNVLVYKPPARGVPYVIGADTAGEGSDAFAAHVLDNRTGEQVAVLHDANIDEDDFAKQVMALGYWYNTALLAPEVNFSTHPVRVMEQYGYPLLFTRQAFDTYTGKYEKRHGFKTDQRTRPTIIAALVAVVRDTPDGLHDEGTLKEMLTFIKNERGRPEAMVGEHDDLVMALAIAHEARVQQDVMLMTEDAFEDDEDSGSEYADGGADYGDFLDF